MVPFPMTLNELFSRSQESLTLNISQMATDMAIVAMEGEEETVPYPNFQMVPLSMILSDL